MYGKSSGLPGPRSFCGPVGVGVFIKSATRSDALFAAALLAEREASMAEPAPPVADNNMFSRMAPSRPFSSIPLSWAAPCRISTGAPAAIVAIARPMALWLSRPVFNAEAALPIRPAFDASLVAPFRASPPPSSEVPISPAARPTNSPAAPILPCGFRYSVADSSASLAKSRMPLDPVR